MQDEILVLVQPVKGALRLAAANRQALAHGLSPGLALADARARIPRLAVSDHDPQADTIQLGRMAQACERWSPLVALDPPDGLLLDVTGCAHLFGDETGLRTEAAHCFRRGGFAVRAVIAGTPDAARALARLSRATIVAPGEDEAAVRPLPIAALEPDEKTCAALSVAGLKRIGDLADLPSAPLTARFGEPLTTQLRRVLGRENRRITPLRPPPPCSVERRFVEPILHAEAIEDAVRWLIGRAAERLRVAGQGGRAFEMRFFRSDGTVRAVRVETARPSRDGRTILRLLRERLDALADPLDPGYGFDLVRLDVPVTEPLDLHQLALYGEDGRRAKDDAVCDLVDRLVARFGPSRVLRFASSDSHDPVRASRLVSAPDAAATPPLDHQAPDDALPRPLQLFEPPQPIEALAEVPDGPPLRFSWRRVPHRIVRAEGPERIAPEWWRDRLAPTRDYYRVEDEQGRRFWVFRADFHDRETSRPRWYLHGLFA